MLEIAIVGMGCRLPGGVRRPEDLWDLLLAKGDGIVDMPEDRWSVDRYYDPDPEVPGKMYTRRGGFLHDSLRHFDPEFFGISPREAAIMDPQQRLLLETAQEALDDAGIAGRVAGRPVGVYIGGFTSDNQVMRHTPDAVTAITNHTATSGTFTMLSNRLSFVFDLRGPSLTIDTACSSSLVALHEAAQAVARGEVEVALAGGVNAMLSPETFIAMCKGRFLAPDGRCKTFDAKADGYARGEGAGVVVLRPLADALRDGDRVYAVIRGTGSNQDGRTSGITVPNPEAQADLVRRVLAESGTDPADVGYVEAHGTGTAVGDPLELAALGATLGAVPGREEPLVVGSVKNSLGHLEAAAGVTSVIKAALTVHNRTVAPQAFLDVLNPDIPFDEHRLRVPVEPEPFPGPAGRPAVVAVNGFGYGGTNAHAILTEPPAASPAPPRAAGARVFPLSARSEAGVRTLAGDLVELLGAPAGAGLDAEADALVDAVWTRRAHQGFRMPLPFADGADLRAKLTEIAAGGGRAVVRTVVPDGTSPVFVFSGMGPQWWRMGRDLLTGDGPFARVAHEIDEEFRAIAGWSVVEEMLRDEDASQVTRTHVAQPANFLVQIGLVAELERYGVRPAAVVGHSVGEVSAAYVSGALDLHDALLVSCHRARLQAMCAGTGSMLAVGLREEDALEWLAGVPDVCVAAVNSPSAVTLAGGTQAVAELRDKLSAEGVFARELRVEVPYHSHLMDPILDELVATLAPVTPRVPSLPLYSTVTAGRVEDASWDARYWADNVRKPVRFAEAVATLLGEGHRAFLEVGPHPVLSGSIREVLVRGGETGTSIPTLVREQPEADCLRTALAELWAAGAIDPAQVPGGAPGVAPHRDLPRAVFQRRELWSESPAVERLHRGDGSARPLPGDRTGASAPEWEAGLSPARFDWLPDHVVAGLVLLPGAAYLDGALSAAAEITGQERTVVEGVRFVAPLVVDEHDAPVVRFSVEPSTRRFEVRSRAADGESWTLHATGRIVAGDVEPALPVPAPVEGRVLDADTLYAGLAAIGLEYGPAFRRIRSVTVADGVVDAVVDGSVAAASAHLVHPAVSDAALQCVAALLLAGGADAVAGQGAMVPAAIGAVRRFAPVPDQVRVVATRLPGEGLRADIVLTDTAGATVLELADVEFRPVSPRPSALSELGAYWLEISFEPLPPVEAAATAAGRAGTDVLAVALGGAAMAAAQAVAEVAGARGTVAVVEAADPEQACAAALPAVRAALAPGRPLVVAICPAADTSPGDGYDGAGAVASGTADVSRFVGVARAVQTVLDEAVLGAGPDGDVAAADDLRVRGVVLTRGSLAVPGDRSPAEIGGAALVGVRRVMRNEQPRMHWRLVDLDPALAPADQGDALVAELLGYDPAAAGEDVDEVALRDGLRMASRIRRTFPERVAPLDEPRPLTDPEESFRIEPATSRALSDLALRQVARRAPGEGEVEVRVDALGLNYKDAMKAIGVLTERELKGTYFGTRIGMEALGVVTRVGPGVDVAVGDRCLVSARGIDARYCTFRPGVSRVDPAPPGWEPADFSSHVPYLTAQWGLGHLARVREGETVLVHGAAGGVGKAAVRVAKLAGAVVIASASTDERRDAARELGADHVVNSRSLTFVDEVMRITGGRGVDVVISSAPGEVLRANLDVAAEFGRVVEVGKTEILGGSTLDLSVFEKNLSFFSVDIDRMTEIRPDLLAQLCEEVLAGYTSGDLPPLPGTLYPLDRIGEAFAAVARGNAGRVVLDLTAEAPMVKPALPAPGIRADGTYLVTGGLGAFGLATAAWLVSSGAGAVVLVGRSGARTPEQQAAVEALRSGGCRVVVEALDAADGPAVTALVTRLAGGDGELPPLRGVFHSAGVLRDEPFADLTAEALAAVVRPKALAAWHLHRATVAAGAPLDHFVLYSSVTSVSGTITQASYAAANAMLDTLAHHRQSLGLPATAINWGALSGGMAESSEDVARFLTMNGLITIEITRACQYLGEVLGLGGAQVTVADVDWGRWASVNPAAATLRFADMVAGVGDDGSASAVLRSELAAMPPDQRVEVLAYVLAEQVATVLGLPADGVDLHGALPDLGLDSLTGVELAARINLALGIEMSPLELTRVSGLAALAGRLAGQLEAGANGSQPPTPSATPAGPVAPAPVEVSR